MRSQEGDLPGVVDGMEIAIAVWKGANSVALLVAKGETGQLLERIGGPKGLPKDAPKVVHKAKEAEAAK